MLGMLKKYKLDTDEKLNIMAIGLVFVPDNMWESGEQYLSLFTLIRNHCFVIKRRHIFFPALKVIIAHLDAITQTMPKAKCLKIYLEKVWSGKGKVCSSPPFVVDDLVSEGPAAMEGNLRATCQPNKKGNIDFCTIFMGKFILLEIELSNFDKVLTSVSKNNESYILLQQSWKSS